MGSVVGLNAGTLVPIDEVKFTFAEKDQIVYTCIDGVYPSYNIFHDTMSGNPFVPIFMGIKQNLHESVLTGGSATCYKHTFSSLFLEPLVIPSVNYDVYSTLKNGLTNVVNDNKSKIDVLGISSATYEEMGLEFTKLKEAYDILLQNIQNQIQINSDYQNNNALLTMDRDSIKVQKKEVENNVVIVGTLESNVNDLEETLIGAQNELLDAKQRYITSGSGFDVGSELGNAGINSNPEYNVAEYLENYITAHQSDIRTNKQTDFTNIDLDYMKLNYKQTRTVK
jgi:hypothetical protein